MYVSVPVSILGIALASYLGVRGILPGWILSPLLIACWFNIGNICWRYEQMRASGPRRVYFNPGGYSNTRITLVWLTFGVFLHFFHVYLRSRKLPKLREYIFRKLNY